MSNAALIAIMGAACLAFSREQPKQDVKRVVVEPTPANSGEAMYRTYCASCHGLDGKGRGPAASAMKTMVPDLTTLSARSGGKFPQLRVVQSITGELDLAAHGSADMPVWGHVFHEMKTNPGSEPQLRVHNLTRYILSLQSK